jgi:uncharacterized membrane protein
MQRAFRGSAVQVTTLSTWIVAGRNVGNCIFGCYLIFDKSSLFILITLHSIYPFVKVVPLLRLLDTRNGMQFESHL